MRNWIQFLLVLLIFITCSGIFAVTVVQVRDTANRTSCQNNLHQLILAIQSYTDTYGGRFPPAAERNPDLPLEKRLSWMVIVMPYVEANNIYGKMDHKKSWDAEENRFAALFLMRTFQCPGYPEQIPESTFVPTQYLGIAGVGTDAVELPITNKRAGLWGTERHLTMDDVKGRTGSLLVLAETSQAHGAWTAAGTPTTRGLEPNGAPYLGVGGQFGGNHRRLVNTAFADGSIRPIEQSINPKVWEEMATLAGREKEE